MTPGRNDMKKQKMADLCDRFWNATARIEEMFLLAAIGDSLPSRIEDLLQEEEWERLEKCFGKIPLHVKKDIDARDFEAFTEWISNTGKRGFLVSMSTPVMKRYGEKGSSYSWGHYASDWFYGDTLENALDKGFAWVEEQRMKENAEYEAKTANAVT
jgi:hypothetical protein